MALTWGSLFVGTMLVWALFFLPTFVKRIRDGESTKHVVGWYFAVCVACVGSLVLLGLSEHYG
jgi:hypothetical protein